MPKKSRTRSRSSKTMGKRGTTPRTKQAAAAARSSAGRKPKKASAPRDADGIAALANELRALAETIDGYADAMRKLRIDSIRPLTGNWDLAMAKLREVVNKQILAKLLVQASQNGYEAHELFRP